MNNDNCIGKMYRYEVDLSCKIPGPNDVISNICLIYMSSTIERKPNIYFGEFIVVILLLSLE